VKNACVISGFFARGNRMSRNGIELIRQSFSILSDDASRVGEVFYQRLNETAPDIVQVFGAYFDGGGSKFQVVSEVVNRHLRSLLSMPVTPGGQKPPIPPAVRSLGQRHAKYAVTDVQFAKMKEALMWTLEQVLGAAFTSDAREAWSVAYDNLADMIQRGMVQTGPGPQAAASMERSADVLARAGGAPVNSEHDDLIAKFFKRTENA
jgi:hemoglobin-like flavoprotein